MNAAKKIPTMLLCVVALMTACSARHTLIYDETQVTTPAKPLARVAPKYPVSAAKKTLSGYVVARLTVTENGKVDDVEIIESVPQGVFDSKGISAIKQWQYSPAELDGIPVNQRVLVRLDWKI